VTGGERYAPTDRGPDTVRTAPERRDRERRDRERRDRERGDPVPRGVGALGVAAVVFLVLPLLGLLGRVPWAQIPALARDPVVTQALRLSLVTSLAALAVSTVLGLPLAWLLARRDFPGRRLVRALAVLPMVLPPVVAGVALLLAFGRRGVLGGLVYDLTGWALPFTTAGVVLAEAFVAMPFLVVTAEAGFAAMDRRYEEAAATLGASRWTVLREVTLPMAAPSVAAGMALCWARALGEFGATITFAGNLPGRTQTMPLAVYLALESNPPAAYLLSVLLLAVSVAVLVAMRQHYLGGR
jgi:molybdate transport system permease protein